MIKMTSQICLKKREKLANKQCRKKLFEEKDKIKFVLIEYIPL